MMVSLATQHNLVEYQEGPFEQSDVSDFLSKMVSLKAKMEEKTKTDNVR